MEVIRVGLHAALALLALGEVAHAVEHVLDLGEPCDKLLLARRPIQALFDPPLDFLGVFDPAVGGAGDELLRVLARWGLVEALVTLKSDKELLDLLESRGRLARELGLVLVVAPPADRGGLSRALDLLPRLHACLEEFGLFIPLYRCVDRGQMCVIVCA